MENQVVRRRLSCLASHIAAPEDISASATQLLPMSCCNSLNSVIRRCDNRMFFARQASPSHACFMRQTTNELGRCSQSTTPSESNTCANMGLYTSEVPMFSRPTRLESSLQNVGEIQTMLQGSNYPELIHEAPSFARPSRADPSYHSSKRNCAFVPNGFQWSPKMDVAESGSTYVFTAELPWISANSIRMTVSDQKLIITGTRAIKWCNLESYSNNSISAYHKKESLQGPYQIVWPLPTNVDKDRMTAEFLDGLLQITIPKLSAVRKSMKACI